MPGVRACLPLQAARAPVSKRKTVLQGAGLSRVPSGIEIRPDTHLATAGCSSAPCCASGNSQPVEGRLQPSHRWYLRPGIDSDSLSSFPIGDEYAISDEFGGGLKENGIRFSLTSNPRSTHLNGSLIEKPPMKTMMRCLPGVPGATVVDHFRHFARGIQE